MPPQPMNPIRKRSTIYSPVCNKDLLANHYTGVAGFPSSAVRLYYNLSQMQHPCGAVTHVTLASLVAQHAAKRDEMLSRISAALRVDDRFVAAWLRGSIGRGEDDVFSDLDLDVIVADDYAAELCARPWQVAGYTSDARLAPFTQFGTPAIIHESQHNAPTGGSFTVVVYDNAL